jgi:hypothetical protein
LEVLEDVENSEEVQFEKSEVPLAAEHLLALACKDH